MALLCRELVITQKKNIDQYHGGVRSVGQDNKFEVREVS